MAFNVFEEVSGGTDVRRHNPGSNLRREGVSKTNGPDLLHGNRNCGFNKARQGVTPAFPPTNLLGFGDNNGSMAVMTEG